ncbi:MAG: hypothetical protein ACKD6N_03485 [Candidatus Bathyarchaeota archaeon]
MGKFLKINKDKKRMRIYIPKEFHRFFEDVNFAYVETSRGILCLIPAKVPTMDFIGKLLEGLKGETGKTG